VGSKASYYSSRTVTTAENRFGTQDQTERYRIELKSRKRKKSESLQMLYNDICRLISLAYPGQTGQLSDTVLRDALLDSLNDPHLKMKILERDPEPRTVEEALRIASRLKALRRNADDDRFEEVKTKERNVRVAGTNGSNNADKTGKHIRELEESLSEYQKKVRDLTALTEQLQQRVTVAEQTVRAGQKQSAQGPSLTALTVVDMVMDVGTRPSVETDGGVESVQVAMFVIDVVL